MPAASRWPVAAAAIAVLASLATALAAPSDWVGAAACKSCHEAEYLAWQRGPHASSSKSLRDDRRGACAGCHKTGEAPAGEVVAANVECEMCHGPGAGYAEADIMLDPPLRAALGLTPLSSPKDRELVCRRCHQIELRLEPFNSEAGWRRLPHGKRPSR